MKILTSQEMREAEARCEAEGLPSASLMENAGRAVARVVRGMLGNSEQGVLVLVGPGNNGGDGLVAARHLRESGASVIVYLLGSRPPDDSNLVLAKERGTPIIESAFDSGFEFLDEHLRSSAVVVDAAFGTGKTRPLSGKICDALKRVNDERQRRDGLEVVSVDLPSGIDADTGAADPGTVQADVTIALGFPKAGLFNLPGAEKAGVIRVADIGIPHGTIKGVQPELLEEEWVRNALPRRSMVSNKGDFGKVMVVAGSRHYTGAAYLACNGALRVGAGLVTLATGASGHGIMAAKLTEATHLPLPEAGAGLLGPEAAMVLMQGLRGYDAVVLGCGLGQEEGTQVFVRALIEGNIGLPLILDADGLNILSRYALWWRRLSADAILTPHPGEMARLTGTDISVIQSDRLGTAKRMSREWNKTVVLKGAYTVVCSPDGRAFVAPFANPGLATAGTGDVLAGVIGGLAAQGMPLLEAAACGVFVHGKAGELVRDNLGDTGMIASDLLPLLPVALREIKAQQRTLGKAKDAPGG